MFSPQNSIFHHNSRAYTNETSIFAPFLLCGMHSKALNGVCAMWICERAWDV